MKIPKSVESNYNEESSYKFYTEKNTTNINNASTTNIKNIEKFDNLLTKRSILFNFSGDSLLSDHVIKLDFYAKGDDLSREEIMEYRKNMMDKCEMYRSDCNKFTNCGENHSCATCSYDAKQKGCQFAKDEATKNSNEKEIKIINILKEYVIDLKYLFAKIQLEDKEVEIFDKIILWMHSLFVKFGKEDRDLIFTRLSNEFYDLDYSYIVVINFLKMYFGSNPGTS